MEGMCSDVVGRSYLSSRGEKALGFHGSSVQEYGEGSRGDEGE